jgi:hypothetical protein
MFAAAVRLVQRNVEVVKLLSLTRRWVLLLRRLARIMALVNAHLIAAA